MTEPQRFQPVPPPPMPAPVPLSNPVQHPVPPPVDSPFGSPPGGQAAQTPAPFVPPAPGAGWSAQAPAPYVPYAPPGASLPADERPPTSLGWAIASIFFFWPLAIPAFLYGNRVGEAWSRGDRQGALEASRRARSYGMLGTLVPLAIYALGLVVLVISVIAGS